MSAADTLRAAGFTPSLDKRKDGAWQRADLPEWVTTDVALTFAAAERAREERALLATLASGFAAQGRHPVECAVYARETFKSLYGRAAEIGTTPADDAAAKVIEAAKVLAPWLCGEKRLGDPILHDARCASVDSTIDPCDCPVPAFVEAVRALDGAR